MTKYQQSKNNGGENDEKTVSLFLCLVMVLFTVTLLASCSKSEAGEPKISKKQVSVDLTDYSIVYGTDMTDGGRQQVVDFVNEIAKLTSLALRSQQDTETAEVETDTKEILIGKTNRVETAKALKDAKESGWVVRVFDNKIVIAGTTPFLTRAALSRFTQNYLNAGNVSVTAVSVNQKAVVSKLETVTLTETVDGAEQDVTDVLNSIRIVASTTLPGADILSPQDYEPVTQSKVTTVDLDYFTDNWGLARS